MSALLKSRRAFPKFPKLRQFVFFTVFIYYHFPFLLTLAIKNTIVRTRISAFLLSIVFSNFNKKMVRSTHPTHLLAEGVQGSMYRPHQAILFSCLLTLFSLVCGCTWLDGSIMRSQSPDESPPDKHETRLIGDYAVPFGLYPVRVEYVGLVTGVNGTGSDPAPSPRREALIDEMQTRGVTEPNTILASGNTSLVLVQGFLRPGIQKGDRFDVEVRVPGQSETTSLRGGYLLETRLTELAELGNQIHQGKLLAKAEGAVLVDPLADPKTDRVLACRGRVLGGGVALKPRSLGLVLKPDHQSVMNSSRIANAVNRRFHSFQNGIKIGVAKAKTEEYIELAVHPRYKDNIDRYVRVVRALAISESAPQRMERIASLEQKLREPANSSDAALQLEAIGIDGVPILLKALESKDPEVRFYSAEALAYLDRREASATLGEIAKNQPAFRVFALTALSSLQDFGAYEQLRDMLSSSSAETRYGAFRALWTMNKKDAMVSGEDLNGQFKYHVLDVSGPPMIHVTHNRLPEIVLFGKEQNFLAPIAVNAGNQIMVNSANSKEITVSKFVVHEADQKRIVSTNIDDVIRTVVELGGTYPDLVQMLQEAKSSGALPSRFEIDAIPEAGRMYERVATEGGDTEQSKDAVKATHGTPAPDLFYKNVDKSTSDDGDDTSKTSKNASEEDKSDEKPHPKKGFFGKMFGFASKEKKIE
jgi:flagellar basal body P-ring protein FlgI